MSNWELIVKPLSSYKPREFPTIPQYRMKYMDDIPNYDVEIGFWIITVLSHAKGERDTQDLRERIVNNGLAREDFLTRDGRIYPMWSLLEVEELKERFPEYFE